jgi:hypothetical protein
MIAGSAATSVDWLPTWSNTIAPGVAPFRQRAATVEGAIPFQPSESTVHNRTYR